MFFQKSSNDIEVSDQDLIQKYKDSGNNHHVGVLFERYSLKIYIICKKYMKEEEETRDTAMQIFEYLLKELKKYDIQNFKSWLGRATKNFCLMKIRKNASLFRKEDEFKKNLDDDVERQDFLHLNGEESKEAQLVQLEQALDSLNDEQRTCVELFYLKNKSYDEVSQMTGFTLKQVKSYIQNGKRNLKNRMTEKK